MIKWEGEGNSSELLLKTEDKSHPFRIRGYQGATVIRDYHG